MEQPIPLAVYSSLVTRMIANDGLVYLTARYDKTTTKGRRVPQIPVSAWYVYVTNFDLYKSKIILIQFI